jgi:hypothetical protein
MGVSLEVYRAAVGLFNCHFSVVSTTKYAFSSPLTMFGCLYCLILLVLFFLLCTDVESNPGPYQNINLKLAHLNVRSLNFAVSKFEEIASIILNQKYDIFALSETWLNDSIPSSLFTISGYCPLIRLDRSDGRRAGGVAVYVTSAIPIKRRSDLESSDFELLWIVLKMGSNNLFCGICYRPPGGDSDANTSFLQNLQTCLDKINTKPDSFVILIGDFNTHYDPSNMSDSSDFGCLLYRWMQCNNLFQVINEPTRITQNGATILDLVITNCRGFFVQSGTLSPPTNCDHSLIFAKMCLSFSKQKCYKRLIWNFHNVNETALCNSLLAVNWESLKDEDINFAYEKWYSCFRGIIESHIPHKTVTKRPRDKPWMNANVRRAIRNEKQVTENSL